jgi:(p)ppGpp synthase/HD superfamily hydrolase
MIAQKLTHLTPQFEAALVYATQLHAQQRRKVTHTPYIAHLLSVAALVLEDGGSEEEAIAALLHDAVEDQGGAITRAEIHSRFGSNVTAIVDGCTEPELTPSMTWKEHKQLYLEQLRQASPQVQRVALADKLHNARSLWINFRLQGESIWNQFSGGKENVLWLCNAQFELFHQTSNSWMVEELERVVRELMQHSGIEKLP